MREMQWKYIFISLFSSQDRSFLCGVGGGGLVVGVSNYLGPVSLVHWLLLTDGSMLKS